MLNKITNLLTLTVQVQDYNVVAQNPEFIRTLRMLTIQPSSGMNHELNTFAKIRLERDVRCHILTAYRSNELVGWGLLSGEKSEFCFTNSYDGFDPVDGLMFQVYVQPQHRRTGIGRELLKTANRVADGKRLCVCPWDETSELFYNRQKSYNAKHL